MVFLPDELSRNRSNVPRHVKIIIPKAQVDTDGDGRVTIQIPYLRKVCGAKVDCQPFEVLL